MSCQNSKFEYAQSVHPKQLHAKMWHSYIHHFFLVVRSSVRSMRLVVSSFPTCAWFSPPYPFCGWFLCLPSLLIWVFVLRILPWSWRVSAKTALQRVSRSWHCFPVFWSHVDEQDVSVDHEVSLRSQLVFLAFCNEVSMFLVFLNTSCRWSS